MEVRGILQLLFGRYQESQTFELHLYHDLQQENAEHDERREHSPVGQGDKLYEEDDDALVPEIGEEGRD